MSTPPLALRRHGPAGGLPLVLLHAFPLDSRIWDDALPHLRSVPVVTLDAPGFGGSAPLPGEPSLEAYADAVHSTLTGAGIGRAVVAGLSMGGYTALALAERHPGLLAGIGLLDTKAEADSEQARAGRLAVAGRAEEVGAEAVLGMVETLLAPATRARRPEITDRVRGRLAEAPGPAIAWAQRAMAARPGRLGVLERVTGPGLVLRGEFDAAIPPAALESMAAALGRGPGPGAEPVTVPGAGHLSCLEAPAEVAAALLRLHGRAR
ncbi:alpha/beta fold hydrolase [Pseudactinotalea sp. HY160]|uniref:alpha/beta fold hydrolase n=1 Tax=Pseudactinotalea sp. HY160 TaxID=2654490 RepID=UPI00128DC424|nr:alpha/beta hydrolase [Pseudactinotalea sp. HY160]MPV49934.1 alpha/beta fold hydrolase [Pseudactinotalea sp. HY160]